MLLLLAFLAQGCGTVVAHAQKFDPPYKDIPVSSVDMPTTGVYRGVKFDSHHFFSVRSDTPGYPFLIDALILCDIPISAAADTLTLPFDARPQPDEKQQSVKATP